MLEILPKNAWNWCDLMHWFQTFVPWGPNTFMPSSPRLIISCFTFYIYCFNLVARIFHLFLIQSTIVIDLNLTVSLILFLAIFFWYSKLFYMPTNLQLKTCFWMKAALDVVILFNFLKSRLYKTKKLRWLKKIIALIFALAEYIDIITKRRT